MTTYIRCAGFVALVLLLAAAPSGAQNILLNGTISSAVDNTVREIQQNYSSDLIYDIFQLTSGVGNGNRFLITDVQNEETLVCNTGLLNSYATTVQAAGGGPGITYSILESKQKTSATGARQNDFQVKGENVAWVPDEFANDYAYLAGLVGSTFTESIFEITVNSTNTLTVAGKMPPFDNIVTIRVFQNPGTIQPPSDTPTLLLGTDSILNATGILLSINYQLKQGDKFPLNEVDPYIAVLDPRGQLWFLKGGEWHGSATPMMRQLFIGGDTEGVLGTFLLGPGFPLGAYTVYGVLNTPYASVYNRVFWRSNLARAQFFVQ